MSNPSYSCIYLFIYSFKKVSCEETSQHFLAVVVVIIFLAAAIAAVVVDAAPVIVIINVAVATAVAVVGSALGRLGRCLGVCIAMGSREAHFGPRGPPGADPKKNYPRGKPPG